ncbi:hypothetical protein BGX27_006299 [Mortierella sp. AM989]|nr:hypothetical protein BGX27_006299 [Mortierella sp. AM989]
MSSVWLAVIYIGGWILSMRIFGYFWKNRKLAINDAEPWFPENEARQQYIDLLQQTEPEATEAQLKTALMRRAMEGVARVLSMREDKQVLANLVKQGTLGDDIWMQFTVSEKELEGEISAVIAEANTFKEGWGQTIFQSASEMVMHEKSKKVEKETKVKKEEEARKQVLEEKRKEQTRLQNEKNREARKERERAKALQDLLAEEEAAASKKKKKSLISVHPLSLLKDIRLGIDGNLWLRNVIQGATEQYLSGIGGTPSGLRKAIEKELENFKAASIHPLFVFSGLALLRKEKPHVNDENKIKKRNIAWESVNSGKMDVALSSWNTSHTIHQPDLIHLVMRILKENGIDYIRAPYNAEAQLVYLERNPKQIIHATFAGPELLIFDIERVITSIDFAKQTFSVILKKAVLQDLMLTDDQFLDLCILAGGDQCVTFPPFAQQSAFAPASVERLQQHRTGFNLIKSIANDQQISKYVDVYCRMRCAMRHHPILTDDGHVEPMNADQAPNDMHEFIGYCLPNEVYYYISRGLISDAALNALLCRYGAEFSPLCNGESKEYQNFLLGDIMKIKAQTMTLIQSQLNTFYARGITIVHWHDSNLTPSQEHVVKSDLAPVKVADISNWKTGKRSVEKDLKKIGLMVPNYTFALSLVSNASDASSTLLAKDEKLAPLSTLAEVQTRHISKLLQLRSFIETSSHAPSPYGKAILDASKAYPTAPPEFQDALFIALELVRTELLTSRPYSHNYTKKIVLEDEAATKAVRLVSRTASLIGAKFKGVKFWAGPLNRDLLAFNSVNKVLTRNLRHLSEGLILQMLLANECQRDALDFTDLATQLPFAYEPSTVLGILVKEYLETLALNGSSNKEEAIKQVEESIGATSASTLADSVKEELQRGFAFWDLVFEAIKSLGSAISKELSQEFQDANNWVKSRKI